MQLKRVHDYLKPDVWPNRRQQMGSIDMWMVHVKRKVDLLSDMLMVLSRENPCN